MTKGLLAVIVSVVAVGSVGCASSSTGEDGHVVRDACSGQVIAHRDASGNYDMANGGSIAASQVQHLDAPPDMSGVCGGGTSGTKPAMWAVQVGSCLYYGDTETSDGFTYSLMGYACQNSDGSWNVSEYYEESGSG